ncbi:MAG: hypothetical protein ABL995_17340 [Bryobacteraceae bacterium]
MTHASSIVWAQWRTLRNYYPRGGVAWTAIVGFIWYGLWTAFSLALIKVFSEAATLPLIPKLLPTALLIVILYWQFIPLLMATTGSSLELKKLRAYPIPNYELFTLEVLLRLTAGIEMVLALIGITIGMTLNPGLPKWVILPALSYVLFNLVIGVGLRDMLGRLLARKRIREVAFFLFVIAAALPQLIITRRLPRLGILRSFAGEPWIGWPWTAASNLMQGVSIAPSAAILLAWILSAFVFSSWQFTRSLRFDADAANASDSSRPPRTMLMERFYRMPSALLPDPMGALIEKEFRFLMRSSRFRLVFLMGFTFGLLIWLPMALGYGGYRYNPLPGGGSTPFFVRNYLTVVSVYSVLLLSEICFWNSFGFDRSAAQFYFLAPIPFSRVLIAKNITSVFFIMLEISVVTVVCALLGMPLDAITLAEAFSVTAVICLFLLSAGNQQSIRQARGVNPANSFRSGAAGRIQAMLLFLYPIAFAPVALAFLARFAFESEAAFFIVLALDAVLGAIVYKFALESAVQAGEKLKEKMIAALSAADGPVSD